MSDVVEEASVFVFRDLKITSLFFLNLNIQLFGRKSQTRSERLKCSGAYPVFEVRRMTVLHRVWGWWGGVGVVGGMKGRAERAGGEGVSGRGEANQFT